MNQVFEESTVLENAAQMVDACRDTYERLGFRADARVLRGVEVLDMESAEIALMLVGLLPDCANTQAVRRITLEALKAVLEHGYVRQAS